jgi:exodeoxyribonuclease VII large subunit
MDTDLFARRDDTEPLRVSQLNRAVAAVLARNFPLVRVRGEIASLMRAASGHWYFTLKDDAAQVRCVMFRSRNALLDFAPRDGDEVEVLAQVGLYEQRGDFQLNVESMRRAGLGRLYEEFLRLKARLGAEGLFDEERKRALPRVPFRIGVVTSPQAAALRDVLTTLTRRAPYARLIVYPVPVQGRGAAEAIAAALAAACRRNEVDVVLLVRGGGSLEDLWAFNEETVARAIRASSIPVVVGVGHESDYTIADFAADLRAPTPTAAAEMAAPDGDAMLAQVADLARALSARLHNDINRRAQRLDYAWRALAAPRAPLVGLQARLQQLLARAGRTCAELSAELRTECEQCVRRLHAARPNLQWPAQRVEMASVRLARDLSNAITQRRARLERLTAELAHLDPNAVLQRGFAIVRTTDGGIVRSAAQLSVGAAVDLTLASGGAAARIERIEHRRA